MYPYPQRNSVIAYIHSRLIETFIDILNSIASGLLDLGIFLESKISISTRNQPFTSHFDSKHACTEVTY